MKKYIILIIIFFVVNVGLSFGQGSKIISHVLTNDRYYYMGSLKEDNTNVYQKLKVEVFGGIFTADGLSSDVYSINTRGQMIINMERQGGAPFDSYTLKVYKNGSQYDFVIEINKDYVSLFVQSWLIDGPLNQITPMTPVNIVKYDPTGKTDVTSTFPRRIIRATDRYGNIGIGTTSPQAKLDVAGTIRAKEVKIEMNAGTGADFVFSPDYQLKPLSEVEAFVKENKHLPEIPSENQMVENGLNVNEMQIRLLQKIEELTLYVIEQNKQNKDLQKQIDELKEQLKASQR